MQGISKRFSKSIGQLFINKNGGDFNMLVRTMIISADHFVHSAGQTKRHIRSDDGRSVSYVYPGLHFSHFGRDGNPTIKAIMSMCYNAEAQIMSKNTDKSLCEYGWTDIGDTKFSFSFHMRVSKLIFDSSVEKKDLDYNLRLKYFGKTSFQTWGQFFLDSFHDNPIIDYTHHVVNIDENTREPKQLPAWKYQDVKQLVAEGKLSPPERIEIFRRPPHAFMYTVYVEWSDTDDNIHANFSSYAKFANDALHAALRLREKRNPILYVLAMNESFDTVYDGHPRDKTISPFTTPPCVGHPDVALPDVTREHLEMGFKEFRTTFFKESYEGEALQVYLWQDTENVNDTVVFCSVERDDEIVSQLVMEYFPLTSQD